MSPAEIIKSTKVGATITIEGKTYPVNFASPEGHRAPSLGLEGPRGGGLWIRATDCGRGFVYCRMSLSASPKVVPADAVSVG